MTAIDTGIPSFHRGLENMPGEFSYSPQQIEGAVPEDILGTLYRNGPGRLTLGSGKMGHWFDGDGMICAFSFDQGQIHFRNRFVRTPKFLAESVSNRIEFRGFGTQRNGGLKANLLRIPANPANTSIVSHADKLLALYEGGRPFELEAGSLETRGEYDFSGRLGKMDFFSAHGKYNPANGCYYNFGIGFSGFDFKRKTLKPCLKVYKIDAHGELENSNSIELDSFPFCHDFALTENYGIFFINSIKVKGLASIIFGSTTMADNIHYQPDQPMQVIIINLRDLSLVKTLHTDPGAIVHFGNAFEEENALIVDAMHIDNFDANDALKDVFNASKLGGGEARRYRIDSLKNTISHERLSEIESEFPSWNNKHNGHHYRYLYSAAVSENGAHSYFNAIQKIDLVEKVAKLNKTQLHVLPQGQYAAEPLFVPSTEGFEEDSGYLCTVVYDANQHRSHLLILDARNLDKVEARVWLDHHIPHQFHGYFAAS